MNKYSIFPIRQHELWDAFKKQEHAFWTAEELDFSEDIYDWENKLTADERYYITHVLAFFAQSDGIVNENLAVRFYGETNLPEARAFYTAQMLIETIHAEVYGLLIDTYIKDDSEKDNLFDAINTMPIIAKKAQWALKWIESQESRPKRLAAFAVVEGIFFSGAFCAIYWLRKRGLMPGLAAANEFIARDEGLHWQFVPLLFKAEDLKIESEDLYTIVREAVEIEKEFISEALPVRLIGMNAELMAQYIEYTADRLINSFGFSKTYNSKNPFDFMNLLDVETKSNFFERRPKEYKKTKDKKLSFDVSF
jgi:ribonucleotide reductase beta subunit family protein with ferritin-like domain